MKRLVKNKTILVILDGWGIGDGTRADAVASANTPVYDKLMSMYPHASLKTYGEHVGLPEGQMGNSEVGHLNIGAGRIVYQDFLRINRAVKAGLLQKNEQLIRAIEHARTNNVALHLMGLVSDGGVHSHQDHLHALIDIVEEMGLKEVYIHAFTDGRDTAPRNGIENIKRLQSYLVGKQTKLVSMIGRYYAMDRDKRWERIKKAYDLLVNGIGEESENFAQACGSFYDRGIGDEFFDAVITPSKVGRIKPGDVVLFFNFRTDRCRQLVTALTQQDFPEWSMQTMPLYSVTMTRYDESFREVHVLFDKDNLENTLGEVVSKAGATQLRIAETEKYPHVTFFFSGGREAVFPGEQRIMVSSPKVATYDLQPEMSALEVTDKAEESIRTEAPDFICLNFANPDMVGHTGVYDAIIKAVETTDACLGRVLKAGIDMDYNFVIIADHGNADIAIEKDGSPHTAHTTNPVPCIVISDTVHYLKSGILADVAPSILKLMGLEQPTDMTGKPLF